MGSFVLSRSTQDDLDELFEYGENQFGKAKAIAYLEGLNTCFNMLASYPDIGKSRDEVKQGLFSFPYQSHIVFYRIFKQHVRIVRVLYGGRDLIRVFQ